MKEPGIDIGPAGSPNIVIEFGNNALLSQLHADAKTWLESAVVHKNGAVIPVSIQFVTIICIDAPLVLI